MYISNKNVGAYEYMIYRTIRYWDWDTKVVS